jgi:predicted amidohydrolase YtcJ
MTAAMLGATSARAQLVGPEAQALPRQADLILTNGKIYTPAGWVAAMAVGRGVILELGDEAALKPYRTARTRVIDLKGQTVLPGLHDMHVHPTGSGQAAMQCELPQGSSRQVILDLTAACAKAKKPGEWVVGRAYEPATFDVPPHKSMLDKAAPNNPVIFTDISGHSAWANSAALKIAGVTRDTPNPTNGIIEKDASGEPTGVLRESANGIVARHVPAATRAETARALKWAVDTIVSQGITAIDDAGVTEDAAQAYADLYDKGQLKLRVRGCLIYTAAGLISRRQTYARDRFSPSCIKIVLDGVPTDSHTAYMLDDYLPPEGRTDTGRTRGLTFVQPDDLNVMLTRFDAMGMTVKMHAAGDAAVREGLDAIAAARKANGFSGVLHDVGHNSFIHMDDIKRARSIGAVFEFSPYIWFDSPIVQGIKKAIGPERMKRWIPIKDAVDAGAFSVIGSDWAVVPSVNPWIALETLVTRRPPGGQGEPVGAEEAITLKQAVDMYTLASARQQYDAHRRGSIERGKVADVIVIDRNIFDVPITTVHDTKVQLTIIDGEVVYDAAKPVPAKP